MLECLQSALNRNLRTGAASSSSKSKAGRFLSSRQDQLSAEEMAQMEKQVQQWRSVMTSTQVQL
jgi:hypothetical protein